MRRLIYIIFGFLWLFSSCKKLREYDQKPDISSLTYGLKTSAAIGYCASVAMSAFSNENLPPNIVFQRGNTDAFHSNGLLFINVDGNHPIPFNREVGQVIIGGLWGDDNSGVISIVMADIDIMKPAFRFYGIYTIPVIYREEEGDILTLFARQDIILGEGSDTILLFNMTNPQIDLEMARTETEQPQDVFAAVKQNVWFVTIDQHTTPGDFYDDTYRFNGGGQIAEATSTSGGIIYHAMIEAVYNYATCQENPYQGVAFIQNIKAADIIDLGTILFNFHETCNGTAGVKGATGIYFKSRGKDIDLGLN